MDTDNPQNSQPVESVEAFLRGLGDQHATDQQQTAEAAFRSTGRSVGCYLLGLLETGVPPAYAVNLAAAMQALVFAKRAA